MVVGVVRLRLHLPENHSLKGKRKVIKRVCERIRHRFNVSVAEVDSQDLWQACEIGISTVGNERGYVNGKLDKVVNFVEDLHLAEIVDVQMEVMNL